jgi:hypothetical protein
MIRDTFIRTALSLPVLDSLFYKLLETKYQKHQTTFDVRNFATARNWFIRTSSPSGKESKQWGDTYFAEDLAAAFSELGISASVFFRDQGLQKELRASAVVLSIRGVVPMRPIAGAINILWIISHPAQLTKRELKQFDFVFAASESWAQKYAKKWKVSISTLLQATNSNLFNTSAVPQNRANNLLFVGNTRGIHRSAVRTASVIRDDLVVVGKGWEKYISRKQIKAQSLTHEQVAREYQNTKVVLCDHWSDMATQGFISNRIFDALACGAIVISDYVAGIESYFNNSVITYNNSSELEVILKEVFSSDSENPVSKEVAEDIAKNHTFLNRAQALISVADKIKV